MSVNLITSLINNIRISYFDIWSVAFFKSETTYVRVTTIVMEQTQQLIYLQDFLTATTTLVPPPNIHLHKFKTKAHINLVECSNTIRQSTVLHWKMVRTYEYIALEKSQVWLTIIHGRWLVKNFAYIFIFEWLCWSCHCIYCPPMHLMAHKPTLIDIQ